MPGGGGTLASCACRLASHSRAFVGVSLMDELYMHGCTQGIYSGCAVEWRTEQQPCVVPLSRRSTQLATWFVMPFYQVYSEAGDFSVKNKCDIMI